VNYIQGDTLSTHSSPYHQPSRQPSDSRSMPPTPQLPRNAYSSIQLRYSTQSTLLHHPPTSMPPESWSLEHCLCSLLCKCQGFPAL